MQRASHQAGTPERCLTRRDVVNVGTPKTTAEHKLALLRRYYLTQVMPTLDERLDSGLDVDELAHSIELLRKQLPKLRGSFRKTFSELMVGNEELSAWYQRMDVPPLFSNRPVEHLYTPLFIDRRPARGHLGIDEERVVSGQFNLYLLDKPYGLLVLGSTTFGEPRVHTTLDIEDAVSILHALVTAHGRSEYIEQKSLRKARISILTRVKDILHISEAVRIREAQPDGIAARQLNPFATK